MLKKKHALPLLTLLLCVVFAALLPVVALATDVADFSGFTYASYFSADYTVASTTGTASASGATISLDATGVDATSGCNSTAAVSSTTTVTLTAKETVSVTCTPSSNVTMSPPSEVTDNADGSKTFIVQSGQKVTFSVTASNATKVSGTVAFAGVEPTASSVPEDCAAFSYNGKVYNYLDKAIADATDSGGTITVIASGKVYHSSVETDEDYESKTFTYTIPVGVTLLLPYSATDTTVQSGLTSSADYLANGNYSFVSSAGQQAPNTNVTYTLTIPEAATLKVADGTAATVGNCGRIVVGGKIASGNGSTIFNGATYKEHSNLVVNGTLDLGNYAVLATTGYVLGSGDIIAEGTGAQIYQPYVVMDFPGAAVSAMAMRQGGISGTTQPSGESKVSPYIYWGVVNIQTDLKLKSGNFMYAYCTLGDDDEPYHTNAVLVGNSSTAGLLSLDSDATFYSEFKPISWSGYSYGLLGRNQIRVEGGASMGSLTLSLKSGMITANIDTSSVTVGIGYNMDITLAAGDNYYIDKSMMLLPGSRLTVADNATLTIGSKDSSTIRFAVWDGLIHRGYRLSSSSKGEYQVASAATRNQSMNYPTNIELDKGGLSEDAEFVINGKLVIGANAAIGGIIQSSEGGIVEVNSAATPSVKVQANILDLKNFNLNYRYMASMSMFDSAAKLNLNGELKTITAGVTYIGEANTELTNSGFTNIYYPGFDSSGNRVAESDLAITYNSAEVIKGIWLCETHTDEDSDHACDVCGLNPCSDCEDTDGDFLCDVCKKSMCAHEEMTLVEAKDGYCGEQGNTAYYTCVCGKYFADEDAQEEIEQDSWLTESKGHTLTAYEANASTCTAPGNSAYWQCALCEKYFSDEAGETEIEENAWVTDKADHTYGDVTYTWTGYTACVASRACTVDNCGHEETANAAIESKVTTAATCTEGGERTYTAALTVDWAEEQTKTEAIAIDTAAHAWDNDCDTTCNNGCGATREITHSYGEWETVTAATCTTDGWKNRTCTVTGCDAYETEVISATGCDYSDDWSSDATDHWHACSVCTEKANKAAHADGNSDHKCDICEYVMSSCTFTVKGDVKTAGTCMTEAIYKANCSVCGAVSDTVTITGEKNSSNHTGVNHTENAREADCENTGYTGDTVCECGETVATGSVIEALGHQWATTLTKGDTTHWYECARGGCDATNGETDHSYEWTTDKAATCYSDGSKSGICDCGATTTAVLSATGSHVYSETYTTENGSHWRACTTESCPGKTDEGICSDVTTDKDHNCDTCGAECGTHEYSSVVTPATHTEGGYTTYTCNCGNTYKADETPATGHNYGEPRFAWSGYECTAKVVCGCGDEQPVNVSVTSEVTTTATCKVSGVETYTASAVYNNVTYTSDEHPTKELGVNSSNHVNTTEYAQSDATCTEVGYTAGTYCDDCQTWISGHEEIKSLNHTEVTTCTHIAGTTTHTVTVSCETCTAMISTATADCADSDDSFACDACGGLLVNAYADAVTMAEEYTGEKTIDASTVTLKYTGDLKFAQGTGTNAWSHWVGFKITSPVDMSKITILRPDNATRVMADIKDGENYAYLYWGMTKDEDRLATYQIDWNGDGIYDLTVELDATAASLLECEHSYGEGVVTTEPTCTEEGVKTYTCANCGAAEKTTLTATGHTPGDEATCTTAQICTVCNTELAAAKGHTEGETVVENSVDPDCDTAGSCDNVIYCTVCDAVISRQTVTVDAKGHSYGEAVEENRVEATATEDGSFDSVVYCTVCSTELSRETVVIPATGEPEEVFAPAIGDGAETTEVNTETAADGTVTSTFQAGTSNSAPTVAVTSPTGGWKLGEENKFTVASTDDKACVVIVMDAEGNYTRVSATTTDDIHYFTAIMDEDYEIIVAVKGDVDGNGVVGTSDYIAIARSLLPGDGSNSRYQALDMLKEMRGDADGKNGVGTADYIAIARSLLPSDGSNSRYQAIVW